ncbi:MAG TPA: glutamate-1-semialdehyde 2,1-aminomutase [Vicinamibacterales bacterium]|jgi:glutamate-1-semialdehyde 2,1-aminomutase|nr:glutamate-1-semialdehyde 2,1-aminomutase [Vicinamibacterales bacterium]
MDHLTRYQERTPRSRELQQRARRVLPLGVESNFRFFDPYPIYIDRAGGSRIWDVDGNEYIDYALAFGALMVGHAHPVVVRAIELQAARGLMYGMPHAPLVELAEVLTARHGLDMIRFTNSGTEATMHALRVARGATGRDAILKFEGAYHGAHDAVLVALKPRAGASGDAAAPLSVPASKGIPPEVSALTVAATFNDLDSVRSAIARARGGVAAIIVEPVMMNIGVVEPEPGFLEGLREICTREGALLIFDEVKTGSKLAPGGAAEYYGVKPDLVTMAKSFGGGAPIGAFGGSRAAMRAIEEFEVFHAGTYNAGPVPVAASLAALKEVLTPDVYPHVRALNTRLIDGYNRIIAERGLEAHATGVGANGCVYFTRRPVRNYRDFLHADAEMFWRYFFGMLNRGIIPCGQFYDEQWTVSVAHSEADIDAHLEAFAEVAVDLEMARRATAKV